MKLEIKNLSIGYGTETGILRAANQVSINVAEGEIVGLVGESGSGKTTVAKSILQLLPDNGTVTNGSIRFDGTDLLSYSESELRSNIRWQNISWIAQNAMNALDPVYRVGAQFNEVIRTHTDFTKAEARSRTKDLLRKVGLDENRMNDYPHELSGGQRQRVVIALALVLDPPLVIADEPTTGLDVVIQDRILELIQDLQTELDNSMLFISHDIHAIAEVADKVAVMYGGEIVEYGPTNEVLTSPSHPYTMALQNAFPTINDRKTELITIPGTPPDLEAPPEGCSFATRCPFATDACGEDPSLTEINESHAAKCHFTEDADEFRQAATKPETWEAIQ